MTKEELDECLAEYEEDPREAEEERRSLYCTCETCGGEFWDGGTSCTCEDPRTLEEIVEPLFSGLEVRG